MTEPDSQPEKPKDEPRYDPELLKKGLRCDLDQYEMLKRCSDEKDITEWNEWRKEHPDKDIWLQGQNFCGWWLKKANFMQGSVYYRISNKEIDFSGEVHLENAKFDEATLDGTEFLHAHLEGNSFLRSQAKGASFREAHLNGAKLNSTHLEKCGFQYAILRDTQFIASWLNGADFAHADFRGSDARGAIVDDKTFFAYCKVNRYSVQFPFSDFSLVALNSVRINPGTKQLLEYNIRRRNWEEWYPKQHRLLAWGVRAFWWMSDYGISTKRILFTFLGLALLFAVIYSGMACWFPPGIVSNLDIEPHLPSWHYGLLIFLRPVYFSVVTMTTLGFGDMYASTQSIWGHILLTIQVILGYVLLGALVTRFAVLFTAGGPAGKFADDKESKQGK